MKKCSKKLLSLAIGSLTALNLPAAIAAEGRAAALEEIVVTSRRVEEALQEVPLSITALNEAALTRSGVQSLADLQGNTPSLATYAAVGSKTNTVLSLRGQMQGDYLMAFDPAVGVYVADVPIVRTTGLGRVGVLDVQTVEILKGPQGTLFGRNTTGGAMLITPNDPVDQLEGSVRAGLGNFSRREVEGIINLPISESVAARFAVNVNRRDGILESRTDSRSWFQDDDISWRAALRFAPSDQLTSTFYADGFSSDTSGPTFVLGAVNPALGGGRVLASALAEQQRSDFYSVRSNIRNSFEEAEAAGISNTTLYELSDSLTIKNVLGYRKLNSEILYDMDGSDSALFSFQPNDGVSEHDQVSEELQLLGSLDRLNWVTGLFYFREEGTEFSTPRLNGNPLPRRTTDLTNESQSVFAQGTYSLTDDLKFTLGARYTWDKREYESRETGLAYDADFSEPTWNVSLDYQVTPTSLLYVAHRHGYRSGGFNSRLSNIVLARTPFDPETVDDIEIGSKNDLQLGDTYARLNVALFYSDYKDIQRQITVADGGFVASTVRNAAAATIYGGEMELTWNLTDNLEISGFVAMQKARYDDWEEPVFNASRVQIGTIDRSDNRFAAIPDYTANLTLRYRLPFVPESAGDLYLQGTAYWQDDTDYGTFNGPGTLQDAYTLYNARIDLERAMGIEGLTLSVWGKNLAEEEYLVGAVNLYDTFGYTVQTVGEPRTFGMDASYKF
jgi:iron complex outermembrane receptor protein